MYRASAKFVADRLEQGEVGHRQSPEGASASALKVQQL